jgi:hypothetical protein
MGEPMSLEIRTTAKGTVIEKFPHVQAAQCSAGISLVGRPWGHPRSPRCHLFRFSVMRQTL